MGNRVIAVSILLIMASGVCPGQDRDSVYALTLDSVFHVEMSQIGIPIPERIFDSFVSTMSDRIKSGIELSRDECALIVRLCNTLTYQDLWDTKAPYVVFGKAVETNSKKILEKLHGVEGRGGGIYFREYHLHLGGPMSEPNSKFKILR